MCNSILPEYLKNIAREVSQKKEKVSFRIKCFCGGKLFDFYKGKPTAEDKQKKKWAESLCEKYNGDFYHDADGNFWLCSKGFLGIGKKKIKLTDQQYRDLMSASKYREVVEIKCLNCGKNHLLFDSNEYGYDGVVDCLGDPSITDRTKVEYKNIYEQAECKIEIRNTCPYEEFIEEFKEKGNYAMYTNAYSDIKIIAIRKDNSKIIFSAETQ